MTQVVINAGGVSSSISVKRPRFSTLWNAYAEVGHKGSVEVTHDPYAETEKYMRNAYAKTSSVSKHSDKKMVFYGCLEVYNSREFDTFIQSQDQYLPK